MKTVPVPCITGSPTLTVYYSSMVYVHKHWKYLPESLIIFFFLCLKISYYLPFPKPFEYILILRQIKEMYVSSLGERVVNMEVFSYQHL